MGLAPGAAHLAQGDPARRWVTLFALTTLTAYPRGAGAEPRKQPASPAAPAEPAAPPPADGAPDPAPGATTCPAGWARRVYRSNKASVVRIEPIGLSSASKLRLDGFVYSTDRHVVGSAAAVVPGRDVWVTLRDGRRVRGHLRAASPETNLALFELDEPAGAPPLELSERPLELGAPIASLPTARTAGGEALEPALQTGFVASESEKGLPRAGGDLSRADVTAVFDCEGKVAAVRTVDVLVPAAKVRELATPAAARREPEAVGSAMHIGALFQSDDAFNFYGLGPRTGGG